MNRATLRTWITTALAVFLAMPLWGQRPPESFRGRPVAAGEVLVAFRGPAAVALGRIKAAQDIELSQGVGGTGTYLLRSRSKNVASLVQNLANRSDVAYVEPNYILSAAEQPDDARFGEQWALMNTGQTILGVSGKSGADIKAIFAWDTVTGSPSQVVAVVDSGIDYTHPDLSANMWSSPAAFTVQLGGRSFACPAGTHGFDVIRKTCDPLDDHAHGTRVAGIIGALGDNAQGISGVNWSAKLMAVKFLNSRGSGTTANALDAIEFVIQMKQQNLANVRVMSNSWGDAGFSKALLEQIKRAYVNDILFVAAAGNQGSDNDQSAFYPASYDVPNVVSVAGTDNLDNLTSSSNFGATTVDLGAPGAWILTTERGGNYDFSSGTSLAAPFVSGAAALVLEVCPLLKAADLRAILVESVDTLASLAGKVYSRGRLNVDRAISTCNVPAFTLNAEPGSQTVIQGGGAAYAIQTEPRGGFAGVVVLFVTGLPEGTVADFDSSVIEAPGSATLLVTTSTSLRPGTYPFMIWGTDGFVSRSAPAWLVVERAKGKPGTNGNPR